MKYDAADFNFLLHIQYLTYIFHYGILLTVKYFCLTFSDSLTVAVYVIMTMFCVASSLAMYSCLEPLVMASYRVNGLPVLRLPRLELCIFFKFLKGIKK